MFINFLFYTHNLSYTLPSGLDKSMYYTCAATYYGLLQQQAKFKAATLIKATALKQEGVLPTSTRVRLS